MVSLYSFFLSLFKPLFKGQYKVELKQYYIEGVVLKEIVNHKQTNDHFSEPTIRIR